MSRAVRRITLALLPALLLPLSNVPSASATETTVSALALDNPVNAGVTTAGSLVSSPSYPVSLTMNGASVDVSNAQFFAELTPQTGQSELSVGTFPADRVASAAAVGLRLQSQSGCSREGSVTIQELSYQSSVVTQLAATWQQRCVGATDWVFGEIRYNSTLPVRQISEPASLVFLHDQQVGVQSASLFVGLFRPLGTSPVTFGTAVLSGANAADFAISADTCSGQVVTPPATCSVSVYFTPSATGTRWGSISLPIDTARGAATVGFYAHGLSAPTAPISLASMAAIDGNRITFQPGAAGLYNRPTSFEVFRGTTADDLASIGTTNRSDVPYGDPFSADLAPGSTHVYAVRALNAYGASPMSDPITVVAPAQARVPTTARVLVVDGGHGSVLGDRDGVTTNVVVDPFSSDSSFTLTSTGSASISVGAPVGAYLTTGTYPISNPLSVPADGTHASLRASVSGSLFCYAATGSLVINDIGVDAAGLLRILDADATFQCPSGATSSAAIRLGTDTGYPAADLADLSLPDAPIGSSQNAALAYTNAGTSALSISGVQVTAPDGSASSTWSLSGANDCVTTLAPGQSCHVGVAGNAAALGANDGAITFTDGTPLGTHTRTLHVHGITVPNAPISLYADRQSGAVTVHWGQQSDLEHLPASYRILRGVDADHLSTLATVNADSGTSGQYTDPDTADGSRTYAVVAVNAAGDSPQSLPLTLDLALRSPTALTAGASVKTVALSWTAPTGMPANPISGYAIFRGTSPTSLAQVATVGGSPYWTGPAPAPGVHAYFAVEAITSGGNGPRSSVVDVIGTASQLIASRYFQGSDRISALSSGGLPTSLVSQDSSAYDIAVTPNGTTAAYSIVDYQGNSVLRLAHTDGSGVYGMAPVNEDAFSPAWGPDNKRLAYASESRTTGADHICLANTSSTAIQMTTCIPNSTSFTSPSWLNTTTLVVEDDTSGTAPLRKLTTAGTSSAIAGTAGGYQPSVSPDGTQVAFLVAGASDFSELIKVVTLSTGAVRTLSAPDLLYSTPSWARDGSALFVSGWSPNGSHIIKVSSSPSGGSTTLTSGADEYSVAVSTPDLTPPAPKINAVATTTLGTSITPSFSATDALNGIASFSLSYRRAAFNTPYSAPTVLTLTRPTAVALAKGYTYCFSVRATDRAGNTSAATPEQCTVVPLDDRSLGRSSGFAALTGSGYYASTVARATALNQAMTRTGGTSFKQLLLVATTCSTCGAVDVLVGGVRVAHISLLSTSTVNRRVIPTPSFSSRSGTVVIKVISSGKPVLIDGLGYRK